MIAHSHGTHTTEIDRFVREFGVRAKRLGTGSLAAFVKMEEGEVMATRVVEFPGNYDELAKVMSQPPKARR